MPGTIPPIGAFNAWVMSLPAQRHRLLPTFALARLPGYVVAVVSVAAAWALRVMLDPYLPDGFPFVTFFPVVVLVAFIYGSRAGSLVAILSAYVSARSFIAGDKALPVGFFFFIMSVDLVLIHVMHAALSRSAALHDRALRLAEDRQLFVDELSHRIRNLLSNVSALMTMAAPHARDVASFNTLVRSRLKALAGVSSLLQGDLRISRIELKDLVALATAGTSPERIDLDTALLGTTVAAGDATSLSLIFHELATNSAKYGALATSDGIVRLKGDAKSDGFALSWIETFKERRTPTSPASTGFGSKMMERVARALGGSVSVASSDTSHEVTLLLPASRLRGAM